MQTVWRRPFHVPRDFCAGIGYNGAGIHGLPRGGS